MASNYTLYKAAAYVPKAGFHKSWWGAHIRNSGYDLIQGYKVEADWWASLGSMTLPVRVVLETITLIATLPHHSFKGVAYLTSPVWLSFLIHNCFNCFNVIYVVFFGWYPSLLLTLQGCGLVLTGSEWDMMEIDDNIWEWCIAVLERLNHRLTFKSPVLH